MSKTKIGEEQMSDEYYNLERRTEIKAASNRLKKQFLTWRECEIVYSLQHRKLLNTRSEQIKSQVAEVKAQVKSTAKSIVAEANAKGKSVLYRVSEFLGIKKKLLNIRENVRGVIKTTDKDIAKTALLAYKVILKYVQ